MVAPSSLIKIQVSTNMICERKEKKRKEDAFNNKETKMRETKLSECEFALDKLRNK